MRIIVLLLLACVVPSLSKPADGKQLKGDDREPATRAPGKPKSADLKPTDIKRKFDTGPVERSDEDINYTYPDGVQLVPNIPVSPQSPKYSLVPIRRLTTTTPHSIETNNNVDNYRPTRLPDFEQEISKIRIPFVRLPGFNSDPHPLNEYEDDEEIDEDDRDELNNNDYFTNNYVEQQGFTNTPAGGVSSYRAPVLNPIRHPVFKVIVKHRPEHLNPLLISSQPSYDGVGFHDENMDHQEEYRQMHGSLDHGHHQSPLGQSLPCNEKLSPRPYGPPQPVPSFRQFNHAPYTIQPILPRPSMPRIKKKRVYVRYPRNYRTYYHHPSPHNRVKVMTQSFVYHPTEYYRDLRNPIMMPSMPELRNAKSPQGKKKKKRKKSKSKGIKGECKPKKIIKEIHFHHYDPQLSAQLAPLEGINFQDGEDYENDIKVITKETEIEDDKKNPDDYSQHDDEDKTESDKPREREKRLRQPVYYNEGHSPQYSDSGSVEYIDYNVQTDSSSTTLMNNPHPSHDYHQNKRSYKVKKLLAPQRSSGNGTVALFQRQINEGLATHKKK